jgi:hypothetical protein
MFDINGFPINIGDKVVCTDPYSSSGLITGLVKKVTAKTIFIGLDTKYHKKYRDRTEQTIKKPMGKNKIVQVMIANMTRDIK